MSDNKRTYSDFLEDINDMINKIETFIKGYSYEKFLQEEKTIFAVIRCFEVMGEAVKNLPIKIRDQYPNFPWKRIAGMRGSTPSLRAI